MSLNHNLLTLSYQNSFALAACYFPFRSTVAYRNQIFGVVIIYIFFSLKYDCAERTSRLTRLDRKQFKELGNLIIYEIFGSLFVILGEKLASKIANLLGGKSANKRSFEF